MLKPIIIGACVFSALQSSRIMLEHHYEGQQLKVSVPTRSSVFIKEILDAADINKNESMTELIDNRCPAAPRKLSGYEVIMIQGAKL